MKIVNKTKNRVVAEEIGIAVTFMQKTVGLLHTKEPASLFKNSVWYTYHGNAPSD